MPHNSGSGKHKPKIHALERLGNIETESLAQVASIARHPHLTPERFLPPQEVAPGCQISNSLAEFKQIYCTVAHID